MNRVFILVTDENLEVIQEMAFMYGINALKFGWMDQVRLIFWGPSQRTLVINAALQEKLNEFRELKGEPWACKKCAEDIGTLEDLIDLDVKTEYIGELLTSMLKEGWMQLTL